MQITPSNVINYKKIKIEVLNFLSRNKSIILTLLLVIFYISLYFLIDFSTQSLVAHDEGLYARRARLIENSDNWFSPPFSAPHHKTLGSYWFTALSIRLFGHSELALRLPSIISSFICLIISYLISLKITNKNSALISVFALSSMPLWIKYSRYASPDIPFVLCILLTILFFLKSIDSSQNIRQYIYIFSSGLCISISFFIRSYMSFIPLIGLSPFVFHHLNKKGCFFKISFFIGILFGSIPTFFNLYYSIQKFGINGITTLFDFARKQAIGDIGINNALLFPLNFLYLTFPVGILFFILFVFARSNEKTNYPLLVYFYPFISLVILFSMSTTYPHYYLFLLPSLSILFSILITSLKYRYYYSKLSIKYILIVLLLSISTVFLFSLMNYKDFIIQYRNGQILIIYILACFLFLVYLTSIRFLVEPKNLSFNLIRLFYNIAIPQYITLSLLFNIGVLGNPNYDTKLFLKDESVASIVNHNTIYLFGVASKIQTLLSYYLPSSKVIRDFDEIIKYKYVITTNSNSFDIKDIKNNFKTIKKSDNHILWMNLGK